MTWAQSEPGVLPPSRRAGAARGMWTLLEPLHALTYFHPVARAGLEQAGLRGFWRGYFAARAAPLGAAGPAVVTALFYNFAPGMVARALPAVWDLASPEQALAARSAAAGAALREVTADLLPPDAASQLARLLWPLAAGAPSGGRALGAANTAIPRPDDPYAAVWQAATTVRELRGDGHVAALVSRGISGLDALILRSALDLDGTLVQGARGWSEQEWSRARSGLEERGLIGAGALTPAGLTLLRDAERDTDGAAAGAWFPGTADRDDDDTVHTLAAELLPLARRCVSLLPASTPIGIAAPWDAAAQPAGPAGTGVAPARAGG